MTIGIKMASRCKSQCWVTNHFSCSAIAVWRVESFRGADSLCLRPPPVALHRRRSMFSARAVGLFWLSPGPGVGRGEKLTDVGRRRRDGTPRGGRRFGPGEQSRWDGVSCRPSSVCRVRRGGRRVTGRSRGGWGAVPVRCPEENSAGLMPSRRPR